ncbi:hypothetical protein OC835_004915 [Tilletia horrida]|nr:hypothetical protein OC835_004915 [Tilletia horrida]
MTADKEQLVQRAVELVKKEWLTQSHHRLQPAEETDLVRFLLACDKAGFPMRSFEVIVEAYDLVVGCTQGPVPPPPIGVNWISRFLAGHEVRLKYETKSAPERRRVKGVSPERVRGFLRLYFSLIEELDLEPAQVFSMDETGLQLGAS